MQPQVPDETAPPTLLRQSDGTHKTIGILQPAAPAAAPKAAATHDETKKFHETLDDHFRGLRDKLANFDDVFPTLHSYFYWEQALL